MNFTVEHKKAFSVIGISTHIEPDEGYIECPKFWDKEYNERYSQLWQTMKPENEEEQAIFDNKIGMFAVCLEEQNGFEYMIAGEYRGGTVPDNMKLHDFPESDWVIFKAKGPLPTALQTLNTEVWQDWYPNEGQAFLPNGSATVEYYTMGDQRSDDYECEMWIPVIKK